MGQAEDHDRAEPGGETETPAAAEGAEEMKTPMIPHEVPLHPGDDRGQWARVVLPADLTRAEANRLEAFLLSLAFEDGNES